MLGRIWYHFDGVTDRIGKDWKTCLWALRIMTEVCWVSGDDSVSIITGLAAWSGRRPSYRWRVLVSRRGVGDDPHIGGVRVWTVCCTSGVQVGFDGYCRCFYLVKVDWHIEISGRNTPPAQWRKSVTPEMITRSLHRLELELSLFAQVGWL